ncbi:transglutaminase domain-containing protein [Geoglobus sp.]
MRKEIAAAAAIASIILLSSFLSHVDFSNTGFEGLIGEGVFQKEYDTEYRNVSISMEEVSLASNSNPPCVPLFVVSGLDEEHYRLRTGISSEYRDGKWVLDVLEYSDPMGVTYGKVFSVTPIVELDGNIPVVKDTVAVSIPAGYNSSAGLFSAEGVGESYYGVYVSTSDTSGKAGAVKLASIDIEEWKMEEIRKLARKITENATSDYERLKMIERYLQSHYRYSPDYNRSADPIYDFLFVERKGVCTHFASAFMALATSLDIPVRAVFGYLAKPTSSSQVVYSCQSHMWVEAMVEGRWVEFDPTPPARSKIPTVTEITEWDAEIVKGENVSVAGRVTLKDGRRVEDGFVEVYLKKNKSSDDGVLLGIARISDGYFRISARVSESGTYSIVAHYTGSLLYSDSWSDPEVRVYTLPVIVVNLPDFVPENFTLRGSVLDDGGAGIANKTVIVEVDGRKISLITDADGKFAIPLSLTPGKHHVVITSTKEMLYAERVLERTVVAGSFRMVLYNTTLVAGEPNTVRVGVYFNGQPYTGTIYVNGTPVRAENGIAEFEIAPESPGRMAINVSTGSYWQTVHAVAKLRVSFDVRQDGDKLRIGVTDSLGDPVSGVVYVNGVPVTLKDGVAMVKAEGGEFRIEYRGDGEHLPSSVTYRIERPWFLIVIPIVAALGVVFYVRMPKLSVEVVKEYPDMPNVWRVGEEIEVRVRSSLPHVVSANGKVFDGKVKFEMPGEYEIVVKAVNGGSVRKEQSIPVRIVNDYGEAVEQVFRMFEEDVMRARGIDCSSLTARELMEMLNVRSDDLLKLFELYEYAGKRGYERKDFVAAFEIYSRLRRDVL